MRGLLLRLVELVGRAGRLRAGGTGLGLRVGMVLKSSMEAKDGGLVLVNGLVRALEGGSDRFRLCRRLGRHLGMRAP